MYCSTLDQEQVRKAVNHQKLESELSQSCCTPLVTDIKPK